MISIFMKKKALKGIALPRKRLLVFVIFGLFKNLSAIDSNVFTVILKLFLELWRRQNPALFQLVQVNLHLFKLNLVGMECFFAFLLNIDVEKLPGTVK